MTPEQLVRFSEILAAGGTLFLAPDVYDKFVGALPKVAGADPLFGIKVERCSLLGPGEMMAWKPPVPAGLGDYLSESPPPPDNFPFAPRGGAGL